MSNQSDSPSIPPTLQKVALIFRWTGRISFWGQLVLAVVASLILLFAVSTLNNTNTADNPATGGGLLFAVLGLLVLYFNIYRAFLYMNLATKLESASAKERPKKADALQILRLTLIGNLVGMMLTLLGAETITGILLSKALRGAQTPVFSDPNALSKFIQPVDIFIVLGNTHIIVAHFIGIVAALWLINYLTRQ